MWLSEKLTRESSAQGAAQTGVTTIGGASAAVLLESERRAVEVFAPGGYVWRPKTGERVLVIKGGEACVAAAEMTQAPAGMADGEVFIHAAGGASVYLKNDGRVEIRGQLFINGTPYTPAAPAI